MNDKSKDVDIALARAHIRSLMVKRQALEYLIQDGFNELKKLSPDDDLLKEWGIYNK